MFLLCFCLVAVNLACLRFRLLRDMAAPRTGGDIHLVAHRGYTKDAPENTLSAFLAAAEAGYTCVETDVRFTADGTAVLIHDAKVDELSDGAGAVGELTLEELLALDFGYHAGVLYRGERIPTLDEGLELCRQLGLDVYLELKVPSMTKAQLRAVSEAVAVHNMEDHVTFSSFYMDNLKGMASRNPSCGFQFLTPGGVADMMSVLQAADWLQSIQTTARSVSIGWEYRHVLSEIAGMAAQSGVALEAWTVDEIEQLDTLPAAFTGVITNRITPSALERWQRLRWPDSVPAAIEADGAEDSTQDSKEDSAEDTQDSMGDSTQDSMGGSTQGSTGDSTQDSTEAGELSSVEPDGALENVVTENAELVEQGETGIEQETRET